jgi:hypothetical protein
VPTLVSLGKLVGAVGALDSYLEAETTQLDKIDKALKDNFASPTPQIFDEQTRQLRSATAVELAMLESRWAELRPRFATLATENRLASFTYVDISDRILLETALRVLPTQTLPDTVQHQIKDGTDPNIKGTANQIADAFYTFDRATLTALRADTVKQRAIIFAQLRAKPTDSLTEPVNKNNTVFNMLNKTISELNTPPRELLLDLIELSPSAWQSRMLATLNKKIQARQLAVRADEMPGSAEGAVNDKESGDSDLMTLQRQKAAVLGLLPEYEQVVALRAIPPTDAKYKDAQAALPALEKQLLDAEAALMPVKPASKPDDPVVAAFLKANGKPMDAAWIRQQLEAQGIYGRPGYVVVLEPVAPAPSGPGNTQPASPDGNMPKAPTPPPKRNN